ncbi:MAG: 3-dehydroquinate synthase [Taibaiella sp.]|nr:3-dehydroquinate synthase [Taibaiella sp.]
MIQEVVFPSGKVAYYFDCSAEEMLREELNAIFLTDENVFRLHEAFFEGKKVIRIAPGEAGKTLSNVELICEQLVALEATRETILVGVGGGVITDIAGFVAAVYMRGIKCTFVPTSLLAMVDAAIGGKNGVDMGLHKNMIGTVRQPQSIYFDIEFLQTLPDDEWKNGFAEVIKYACIFDHELFEKLEKRDATHFKTSRTALKGLVQRCADWKNKTVVNDELETGERKLLNFGHTAGHAIETLYHLPHGQAVAVGMMIAARIGEKKGVSKELVSTRLEKLLQRYGLPVATPYKTEDVMSLLRMDKKRSGDEIQYILMEEIGKGIIRRLSFATIEEVLRKYENND